MSEQHTLMSYLERKEQLPFYSEHAKQLEGTVGYKIRRILRQNALEYIGGVSGCKQFICKSIYYEDAQGNPKRDECGNIEWYNKTTYHLNSITIDNARIIECSCQGWQTKADKRQEDMFAPLPLCSHSCALYEKFKRDAMFKQEILRPSPATTVPEVILRI